MNNETQNQLEQHVIGIALQSKRDLLDLTTVKPEWFTNPVHAETWRIIQHLDAENQAVDPIIITGNLHHADQIVRRQINLAFLADCATSAPYGHPGQDYARRLKESHDRHTTAQALTRGQQLLSGEASTRDVRLTVMEQLQAITDESTDLVRVGDAAREAIRSFDEITPYTPTPWWRINKAIRGWRPGGLYAVGARPGVGKSLFLQYAALDLAKHGTVIFETMEMSPAEVSTRFMSMITTIPQEKLVGRDHDGMTKLSEEDWAKLNETADYLESLPILFGEKARTPADIRERARAAAVRGPIAGIFVDYVQLLGISKNLNNRVPELTSYTRQLKQMAMEFDCPVIVAAQMNRNAANAGRPPALAEFRESGSLEQDADVAIILHEDSDVVSGVDPMTKKDHGTELDAHVAKNRQGPQVVTFMRKFGTRTTILDDLQRHDRIGTKEKKNEPWH